jgi:hypothetical protein
MMNPQAIMSTVNNLKAITIRLVHWSPSSKLRDFNEALSSGLVTIGAETATDRVAVLTQLKKALHKTMNRQAQSTLNDIKQPTFVSINSKLHDSSVIRNNVSGMRESLNELDARAKQLKFGFSEFQPYDAKNAADVTWQPADFAFKMSAAVKRMGPTKDFSFVTAQSAQAQYVEQLIGFSADKNLISTFNAQPQAVIDHLLKIMPVQKEFGTLKKQLQHMNTIAQRQAQFAPDEQRAYWRDLSRVFSAALEELKPVDRGLNQQVLATQKDKLNALFTVRADTSPEAKKLTDFDAKQRQALENVFKK